MIISIFLLPCKFLKTNTHILSTSERTQYLHLLIEFSTACTTLRQSCILTTLYQHNQLFKNVCCPPVSSSSIVLEQCMNDSFQCKDQWGITWMSHGDGSLFISNVDTCEEGGASLAWLMRCLSMSMPYSCWDLRCRKQGRLISNHPPPKLHLEIAQEGGSAPLLSLVHIFLLWAWSRPS